MTGGGLADILEAPPIDLRGRGFRRVTRARRAWDKRISEDVVWRISIDDDRRASVYAGVVVPFFAGCRQFADRLPPLHEWKGLITLNATTPFGWLAKDVDVDRPRRRIRPWLPQTAPEQLAWVIDQQALPYLERFTNLEAVLQENIAQNAELARKYRQPPVNHWDLAESAMLRWRLGDLPGAEADLELADASIVRRANGGNIWPPSAWFAPPTAEEERFADETYKEHKAFVRGVLHFVRTHDSTKPVIPVPLWPGLDEAPRTWRAGTWRKRNLKTPWTEPTLLVQAHDQDVVAIMYGPTTTGSGTAWLGPGPQYFDDDATYNVEDEAEALATWALAATGAPPDITALRTLISPSWTADLVESLTQMCRLLGLKLPKN